MFSVITPLALGWITGTALQLQQAQLWAGEVYWGLAAVTLMTAYIATRIDVSRFAWIRSASNLLSRASAGAGVQAAVGFALVAALSALMAFAQAGARASHYAQSTLKLELEGRTLQVVGIVANLPQRMEDSARFRFEVESARNSDGALVQLPAQLLLGWYGNRLNGSDDKVQAPPADFRPGDRWQLAVRLKAPHGHINPHGFDYELWLWEQGLQATGYVRNGAKDAPPQWLGGTWAHPVERLRQRVRSAIDARVADRAMAGIVAALLVGDQAAIERADWDVFRATGVAHLMAISGLHITGLAWLAALCVGWLWRRSDVWSPAKPWSLWLPAPIAASACAAIVALAYAVFTGWGVPAQRTVWMLGVVSLLRVYGLRWPLMQVWLTVCAVVLALDPWALMQAGFWLSFVAVAVLFASGSHAPVETTAHSDALNVFDATKEQSLQSDRRGRFLANAWASAQRMLREQWQMSVCLAPLTLLLFHQVSVVGLFANLLAVPWVTLVVTPLCLLGLVLPLAWSVSAEALQWLVWLLKACAGVSWAQWSAPAAPLWAGAAALVGMGVWAMRVPMWLRCFGVALVLPVLSWQTPRPAHGTFELVAADMGQGHAVLVRTATHSLLYDTGPRYSAETDAGQRVLVPLLRAWGERLDRIVISHQDSDQDSDHSGGAPAVMAMQPQADVLTSIALEHPLQALGAMQRCERGQSWVWDGVRFEVLHPSASDYERKLKPNALSCVLRVTAADTSALLAGDIEAAQEQDLLQSGQALQADWLLVPHHGSATSSTQAFLDAVQPSVAIVQAGYRNRFAHPRPDVLRRYSDLGVLVVQTPRCGASTWRSEQPKLVQCERNQRQRYWQHVF
ncbi:MAG: DNA internalization-related competence protein ComEC/Rec2 [Burkholderiales bacterium 35-55-47]|nr:DNA internalization-related competence protein ComEC/Rec2 [Limnohabitans sp.]OYY18061.1 MAG: DNA internalization-related competence protein ComEC/Rec2 [Burkholderiales bacterium 35-55-47]OYZ73794.1 MAG: DNA internalization-related competence protein ComEC/Rec2 [Burkholderiales bacterium 24-55-52]OZB00938.1 MAG: DNA internalization-related competence protein ComEC/Rec2 [Burkholderiales bacterium 39-55-53]HQR85588.1 DNA internalization-related competence protein ComEC/Rec2 [Limnohabitans sp.]